MAQKNDIIEYMQRYGEISPLNAMRALGIMRLSARIHDLRQDGYDIETIMRKSVNRKGDKVTYAAYRLTESGKDGTV